MARATLLMMDKSDNVRSSRSKNRGKSPRRRKTADIASVVEDLLYEADVPSDEFASFLKGAIDEKKKRGRGLRSNKSKFDMFNCSFENLFGEDIGNFQDNLGDLFPEGKNLSSLKRLDDPSTNHGDSDDDDDDDDDASVASATSFLRPPKRDTPAGDAKRSTSVARAREEAAAAIARAASPKKMKQRASMKSLGKNSPRHRIRSRGESSVDDLSLIDLTAVGMDESETRRGIRKKAASVKQRDDSIAGQARRRLSKTPPHRNSSPRRSIKVDPPSNSDEGGGRYESPRRRNRESSNASTTAPNNNNTNTNSTNPPPTGSPRRRVSKDQAARRRSSNSLALPGSPRRKDATESPRRRGRKGDDDAISVRSTATARRRSKKAADDCVSLASSNGSRAMRPSLGKKSFSVNEIGRSGSPEFRSRSKPSTTSQWVKNSRHEGLQGGDDYCFPDKSDYSAGSLAEDLPAGQRLTRKPSLRRMNNASPQRSVQKSGSKSGRKASDSMSVSDHSAASRTRNSMRRGGNGDARSSSKKKVDAMSQSEHINRRRMSKASRRLSR